jgi:uncharacterized DUF497 family protein
LRLNGVARFLAQIVQRADVSRLAPVAPGLHAHQKTPEKNRPWAVQKAAHTHKNVYNRDMNFIWDEDKHQANLRKHGLDFAYAAQVFGSPMVTFEDRREDYGEQRMIGLGMLEANLVVVVYVEILEDEIRILSLRKAERHEKDLYYQNAGYF